MRTSPSLPRTLSLCLCLALSLACSRPTTTDCPPPSTDSEALDAEQPAPAPEPAPPPTPGASEALSVTADDGHELRLWRLAPPAGAAGEGASEDRRAVLLLHGRTWSSIPDFDLRVGEDPSLSLMYALAERGIAAYALDLRGYGGSARDDSGWLSPDRAAADLAAGLAKVAELEGEAPDLLGWSMGSLVAQHLIQAQPELARSLVLYGYPRDLDMRVPPLKEGEHDPAGDPPSQANTAENAASDFITEGTISKEAIDAYVAASLEADPVRVDWRDMHEYNALDAEQLKLRTLVIHGVHDPIAKPLWQTKLFARLRGVEDRQWVVIPHADHAAHLEQPQAFMRALLAFWAVD